MMVMFLSVILAKNREIAEAYWHGADIYPHAVFKIELQADHPTGIVPIITTDVILAQDVARKNIGTKIRVIRKSK